MVSFAFQPPCNFISEVSQWTCISTRMQCIYTTLLCDRSVLEAFGKQLRKSNINFVTSVRLSVRMEQSCSQGTGFRGIAYWVFYLNLSPNSVGLKSHKITELYMTKCYGLDGPVIESQ